MLNIIHCKFSSHKIKFMVIEAHALKLSTFRGELASTEATTVK